MAQEDLGTLNDKPQGSMAWLWWIIGLLVIAGLVWLWIGRDQVVAPTEESTTTTQQEESSSSLAQQMSETAPASDNGSQTVSDEKADEMKTMTYTHVATLTDVTIDQGVTAVDTGGIADGTAKAVFADGTYSMLATFAGLPDPDDDFFYEGWVVRPASADGGMSVISTGQLTVENGVYTDTYMSSTDLTDHTRYVLTIEPDDGDPAPAEHVVEGIFTEIPGHDELGE